jgi:hypothetical protein
VTPRSTSLQTMDENEILARFGLVPHVEETFQRFAHFFRLKRWIKIGIATSR